MAGIDPGHRARLDGHNVVTTGDIPSVALGARGLTGLSNLQP
jgi:hypothetical protein